MIDHGCVLKLNLTVRECQELQKRHGCIEFYVIFFNSESCITHCKHTDIDLMVSR